MFADILRTNGYRFVPLTPVWDDVRDRFQTDTQFAAEASVSPVTYASGRRPQGRGCDHAHAIRVLVRVWLRVLWRAWIDRKFYEPDGHKTAQTRAPAAQG